MVDILQLTLLNYVTISSTGDANDFGDLFVGQRINPNHVFRLSWWSLINMHRGIEA